MGHRLLIKGLTFVSWAIALLPSRGPLPYFHLVGHCPTLFTFISWAIALLLSSSSWAIALLLRTIFVGHCPTTTIFYFAHLQNSVITFVLRGCDSISLVPYVPGPILATICCSTSE